MKNLKIGSLVIGAYPDKRQIQKNRKPSRVTISRFTTFAIRLHPIHKLLVHVHSVAHNSQLRRFLGIGIFGVRVHTFIRVRTLIRAHTFIRARCLRGWL